MAVQVHGLRLFPPFLSSFVGSYTPAYKGRGPHPHRWILVEGSMYPLGDLRAALLVLFATGRSATMIVPGTHFLQAQLGVMLRGKLVVGPQALINGWASTATTRMGLVCQRVLVVPTGHLGSPQASNINLHKGDPCGYSGELDDIGGRPPPAPPGLSSLPFVVTPVPSGTRFAPSRCLEPLLSPRNAFP